MTQINKIARIPSLEKFFAKRSWQISSLFFGLKTLGEILCKQGTYLGNVFEERKTTANPRQQYQCIYAEISMKGTKETQFGRIKTRNLPEMLSKIIDNSAMYRDKLIEVGNNRFSTPGQEVQRQVRPGPCWCSTRWQWCDRRSATSVQGEKSTRSCWGCKAKLAWSEMIWNRWVILNPNLQYFLLQNEIGGTLALSRCLLLMTGCEAF